MNTDDIRAIHFPLEGNVRAKQAYAFLAIGKSTFHLYVQQGRIKKPMKYSPRTSVWSAEYIRDLAKNGIPEAVEQNGAYKL